MRIHLYCPDCLAEMSKSGMNNSLKDIPPILSDAYELLNDGVYSVQCPKGHHGKVVLNNLNFELLFDLGINAIGDGYYREAVASMTSALERFYEFFIKTIWCERGLSFDVIDKNWKTISSQSERQLGAYVMAYSSSFGENVPLMNNNQTSFRNSVIHKGEIPTREKTVKYAGEILQLIDCVLDNLRTKYAESLRRTFNHYTPHYEPKDENENVLTINHPTIISASHVFSNDDPRKNRDIESLINMVLKERHQHRMWFIDEEERELVSENYEKWLSKRLDNQNHNSVNNEYQMIVDSEASAEDCLNLLGKQLEGFDFIFTSLYEDHPEVFSSDIMTVYLTNTSHKARLYYLYLRVKIFQLKLNESPNDEKLKDRYEEAEKTFREFHNGLMVAD